MSKFIDFGAEEEDENGKIIRVRDDEYVAPETAEDRVFLCDDDEESDGKESSCASPTHSEKYDCDEEIKNIELDRMEKEDEDRAKKAKSRTRVQRAESSSEEDDNEEESGDDSFIDDDEPQPDDDEPQPNDDEPQPADEPQPDDEPQPSNEVFSEDSMNSEDLICAISIPNLPKREYSPHTVRAENMYTMKEYEPVKPSTAAVVKDASWDFFKQHAPMLKSAKGGYVGPIRTESGIYYQKADGKRTKITEA